MSKHIFFCFHVLVLIHTLVFMGSSNKGQSKELEKIFLISHTHLDAGWQNTFEEYFNYYVSNIYSVVVNYLKDDKNATFAICEMGFFKKFYDQQSNQTKQGIKRLVSNGQIEFVNGGWVSNDEAVTYYSDIILQMRIGNEFILQEFNSIPRVAWNIDVFGHSNAMHFLLSEMGFDYSFFTRDSDTELRKEKIEMEFVWYPFYKHFQTSKAILAHSYYYQYYKCYWDIWQSYSYGTPGVDSNYNYKKESVIRNSERAHKSYRSSNFMLLIGGDFTFGSRMTFQSISDFLKVYKNQSNVIKIESGTPSKYFENVHSSELIFPSFTKDIFPLYNDFAFWTGYYTSWPSIKYLLRESSKHYRAYSIILTFLSLNPRLDNKSYSLVKTHCKLFEEILSLAQHHDVITGTSKKYVIDNSISNIYSSLNSFISNILNIMKTNESKYNRLTTCIIRNSTLDECPSVQSLFNNNSQIELSIFNPSMEGEKLIKFKVPSGSWNITGIKSDIICEDSNSISPNYSNKNCTFYFIDRFKSYETKLYLMKKIENDRRLIPSNTNESILLSKAQCELKMINFTVFNFFCPNKELLIPLKLEYKYYEPSKIKNSSGLYIFTTQNNQTYQFNANNISGFYLFQGTVVDQLTIIYPNIEIRIRMSDAFKSSFEIETFLPRFDSGNATVGKEVILSLNTTLRAREFWTDSNGMEMQQRIFKNRTSDPYQKISSNYFPVTTAISTKDNEKQIQVSVLTDRPEAASVIHPGVIEMLIHRMSLQEDDKGVNEGNSWDKKSIGDIRLSHLVLINKFGESTQREYERMLYEEPVIFFHNSEETSDQYIPTFYSPSLYITKNIDLSINDLKMDLHSVSRNEIDITLYNTKDLLDKEGINDSPAHDLKEENYVKTINIKDLAKKIYEFSSGSLLDGLSINYEELTLNRNQKYKDMIARKKKWKSLLSNINEFNSFDDFDSDVKTFEPQRIRVFRIKYIN